MIDEETHMDTDQSQESPSYNSFESGSDNQQVSSMDDDYVCVEQEDTKKKLNQAFELVNVKKIDDL